VGRIKNYGHEIWTVDYTLKKKLLNPEKYFWKTATRTSKLLTERNGAIRKIVINENN
jgi:hypothetical protein